MPMEEKIPFIDAHERLHKYYQRVYRYKLFGWLNSLNTDMDSLSFMSVHELFKLIGKRRGIFNKCSVSIVDENIIRFLNKTNYLSRLTDYYFNN